MYLRPSFLVRVVRIMQQKWACQAAEQPNWCRGETAHALINIGRVHFAELARCSDRSTAAGAQAVDGERQNTLNSIKAVVIAQELKTK